MTSSAPSNHPSTSDERLRLEFNDWAKAGRGEGMERGHRPVGEQAIELMAIKPDARVLDVGCGSGWACRLMAAKASAGKVVGIDISDEMVRLAADSSTTFANVEFQVASAEKLPFADGEFSDAFSMESLYYYADILTALKEIRRVVAPGGQFVTVVDLYQENLPSHQWVEQLKVPVQLLSIAEYQSLFERAGFVEVSDRRLIDPTPIPVEYSGGSFKTREELVAYREAGSLLVRGMVAK
jgi:ubiquinone/menaquinone biosynthesis C-methylase UbiE